MKQSAGLPPGGQAVEARAVDVTFAAGGRRRFDLVTGADGLPSALRSMGFGPRERCARHLELVLAYFSVPAAARGRV